MSKSKDTIKTDSSETVRLSSDETIKINDTVKQVSQTEIISGKVIESGFAGSIVLGQKTDNLYRFNNKEYRLIAKISDSTSEAQIFLIERDAKQFVLKYYYPFVKPKIDLIKKILTFKHPDIILVIDYGYFEDRFFEILEYADQGSLIDNLPINDIELIKKFIGEINEALNYFHQNGIIHRDIKPSNIFLKGKNKDDVIVGDFGIASLIDEGELFRRTNIFQTPIYAAPEYRMNLRGETLITKAVDYYAFGITIWEIWTGEVPPKGMDDLEFLRSMFDGDPPLQNDINDEIVLLIKGLTQRDHLLRWGYSEVKKWLKGEAPEIKAEPKTQFKNIFDFGKDKDGKKLTASTPKELAKLIDKYPELGRKHLYRGTIKEWLKEHDDKKLFIEIADITDYKFKNDEETGTTFAVYTLDGSFPYYGVDGKPHKNKKEIISVIDNNISEYQKLLSNPNDRLYLYFLSKNAVDEVEKYRDYFERYDKKVATYYVIYDLRFSVEKNVAYYHWKEKGGTSFDSLKDLADYLFDFPVEAEHILKQPKFAVWLNFMNADVHKKYMSAIKEYTLESKELPKLLPYIIDPERGYEGLNGNMCYNLYELGKEFDEHFYKYKKILKDKNSKIYTYLKMKGYNGTIEYCQEVFVMEDAQWRNTPYNDNVALMKIIRGFGWIPKMDYKRTIDNKPVKISNSSPEDLYKNSKLFKGELKDDLEKSLNNQNSVTIAWISIFFHEYPLNKDGTSYMYGRKNFDDWVLKFILFFVEYFPHIEIAKRYKRATEKVKTIKSKFATVGKWNLHLFLGGMFFPFAASVLLLTYSYFYPENNLPKSIWKVNIWYFIIVTGVTVLYLYFSENSELGFFSSIVTGTIVGAIAAIVIFYAFSFVMSNIYILSVLLVIGFYLYFKSFSNIIEEMESLQEEETVLLNIKEVDKMIVSYTFSKIDDIEMEVSTELYKFQKEVRYKVIILIGYAFIVTSLLIAILFLLIYLDISF